MKMPEGTVFSSYEPDIINNLYVTGGQCGADFLVCCLLDGLGGGCESKQFEKLRRGEEVPLVFADAFGREGLFDEDMAYAVWSKDDVRGLAAFLLGACL